jgi:hypothetical protein
MIKYSTLPQNNAFTPDLAVLVRVLATTAQRVILAARRIVDRSHSGE